jgi:hypothetical protein
MRAWIALVNNPRAITGSGTNRGTRNTVKSMRSISLLREGVAFSRFTLFSPVFRLYARL